MIDVSFLKALNRFSIILNKRLSSLRAGQRRSLARGRGTVFKDYRIYATGDDFRTIDWRVFARTDDLYVKLFEEERNLTVHIIIDYSGSMDFGDKIKKYEYAAMIGMGYAYMALRNNERFVLSTFSDAHEIYRAQKGRGNFFNIVKRLNEKKPSGITNFKDVMLKYYNLLGSKSLVVIISDFLYDLNDIREVMYRLKGHEVKMIQVLDHVERDLNLEGDFKLKDAESNVIMRTFIGPFLKRNYKNLLENHISSLRKIAIDTGADFHLTINNVPIFETFVELLSD